MRTCALPFGGSTNPAMTSSESTTRQLRLAPAVSVDYRETTALAHRLLSDSQLDADLDFDEAALFG